MTCTDKPGIGHMRGVGGYNGWRFIFILVSPPASKKPQLTTVKEGLLTIVVGVIAYWFISNYPDTVSWLSNKERAFIKARLKADSDATNDEAFSWDAVLNGCKDPKVWLYGLGFHTMSLPLYTIQSQQSSKIWATPPLNLNYSPSRPTPWPPFSQSSGPFCPNDMQSADSSSSSPRP